MGIINISTVLTTILIAVVTALYKYIAKTITGLRDRLNAQDMATVSMLRMDLRQEARRFLVDGVVDYDALEDWEDMYKQYHALGGNGTMTALKTKIEALPIRTE